MPTINISRFGFALGGTLGIIYAGCVFVMMTVPQDAAVLYFNSLLHGIDVTTIIRWDMPWTEMVIGILEWFILGWLAGATFAVMYNVRWRR